MIEETLRCLLKDPNVPPDLAARAVTASLEAWQSGTLPANASEFVQRFTREHAEYRLKGPPAGLPGLTTRVTRVMSERAFCDTLHRNALVSSVSAARQYLRHLLDVPSQQQFLKGRPWESRYGVNWVTLADELTPQPENTIADKLGLSFLTPARLLTIAYTIPSADLQVPTIFDADGAPYFASKPVGEVPRAWNFRTNQPGLVEVVHKSSAAISDPVISALGDIHPSPISSPLAQITLPVAIAVSDAVKYAIRTAEARTEITAFLDEKSDFLHLTDREFELFLGALYKLRGYDAKVTKATRDGGFDVIAVRETTTREQILLQAKKTEGTVGVSVIRELAGARYFAGAKYEGSILVVATTGKFSQPARQLEHQCASELQLHDYVALKDMVSTARGVTLRDIAQDSVKLSRLS